MTSLMQLPLFTSLHWCSCHLSPARWLLHGWECGFVSLLPGWEDGYIVLLVGWRYWWWRRWRSYHDTPIHAMENLPSMVDESSIKLISEESPHWPMSQSSSAKIQVPSMTPWGFLAREFGVCGMRYFCFIPREGWIKIHDIFWLFGCTCTCQEPFIQSRKIFLG